MKSSKLGVFGEKIAIDFYTKQGYDIKEINYRTRMGEIDFIANKNEYIVFVEVKTRSKKSLAMPREWVGLKKQQKIILAAKDYIYKNEIDSFMRFDVVEVFFENESKYFVNCIENAFTL